MSCQRHADTPFVTLMAGGNRPDRHPPTTSISTPGITGAIGGSAVGSPMTISSLAKPTWGSSPAGRPRARAILLVATSVSLVPHGKKAAKRHRHFA